MAKNTTNQNRSKHEKLSKEHVMPTQNVHNAQTARFLEQLLTIDAPKEDILYSLGKKLVSDNQNSSYISFLDEYDCADVVLSALPDDTGYDLLGSAYQYLNTKSDNLATGSFYTGYDTAVDFCSDLDFSCGQTIFDPSCGSGSFLFASNAPASQIHGVDADPIAVMIAKFNYWIKFPDAPTPDITCQDFFSWLDDHSQTCFDYVIGNPPYGADIELDPIRAQATCVKSGESFSYFIEACYPLATQVFRFLIPEALLNVKRHTDIRKYILEHADLIRIKDYSKNFSGVMSDTYMIEMKPLSSDGETPKHGWSGQPYVTFESDWIAEVPKSIYAESSKKLFLHLDALDIAIIEKMDALSAHHLPAEAFALGVVTGGNKGKLFSEQKEGTEPIYTGKEITGRRYTMLTPKNHIIYDRKALQQVAPDHYYRTKPKLVYKAINKYLRFTIEETGSLTTNSANIVLPQIEDMSPYVLLALLNSRPFSFYNLKMFGGVNKVAKENLMALPIPDVTYEQQRHIEELIKQIIKNGGGADNGEDDELLDFMEQEIYDFSESEREHLRKCLPF